MVKYWFPPADSQQQWPGWGAAAVHEGCSTWKRWRQDSRADQPQGHDAQQAGTQAHTPEHQHVSKNKIYFWSNKLLFFCLLGCRSGCCGRYAQVRQWSLWSPAWCQCCWRDARTRPQRPDSSVGSVWGNWGLSTLDAWICHTRTPMATTTPLL